MVVGTDPEETWSLRFVLDVKGLTVRVLLGVRLGSLLGSSPEIGRNHRNRSGVTSPSKCRRKVSEDSWGPKSQSPTLEPSTEESGNVGA